MSNAPPRSWRSWPQRWQHYGTLPWAVVLWRVLVGGVFLFAGFSKLLLPHAEVIAHVQQYQLLAPWLVALTAAGLPWVEVASGTALFVGLYTTWAARLIAVQLVCFSGLMVLVLVLGIPIDDCGCFGKLGLPETPLQVLVRDLVMLALVGAILRRQGDICGVDALTAVAV